jgi:hypothetical protein
MGNTTQANMQVHDMRKTETCDNSSASMTIFYSRRSCVSPNSSPLSSVHRRCSPCSPTPSTLASRLLYSPFLLLILFKSEYLLSSTDRRGGRQRHRKLRAQMPYLGCRTLSTSRLAFIIIFFSDTIRCRSLARSRAARNPQIYPIHQFSL